ncbi:hypothetical protein EV361DRAFT_603307 [Lentinula raphanica]|nr:hypothetical protein EV361DRAFT_603307 [Lentinula raphanica]
MLTSREDLLEVGQDSTRRVGNDRQKQTNETQRADIIRRPEQEQSDVSFSGNLKTMKAKGLVDIASSLTIPSENITADVLRSRLIAHFDANKELKKNPRYIGLLERTRKRKDPLTQDVAPPFYRRPPPTLPPQPSSRQPLVHLCHVTHNSWTSSTLNWIQQHFLLLHSLQDTYLSMPALFSFPFTYAFSPHSPPPSPSPGEFLVPSCFAL